MLQTAPSLSIYNNNTIDGVEEQDQKQNGLLGEEHTINNIKSLNIREKIDEENLGSGDFSFVKQNMDLIKEEGDNFNGDEMEKLGTEENETPASPSMYLASGLGICHDFDSFKEDREDDEEYYIELLQEHPNHPLILKKYAQLLQRKGDLQQAEEYYFRATKADPGDGEIMSQYAMLVWELHGDQERASAYFELAAQTAPKDSNVLAAYAKFLWEIDDDGDENSIHPDHVQENQQKSFLLHPGDRNGVGIDGLAGGNNGPIFDAGAPIDNAEVENYYRRMIEEDPSNSLFLKKYAQFLYQSKCDLQGAEEYYSRALLAYPNDGEMLSQYATLLWELYHDQKQTLIYMERAIEASPGDSNILAAYARFLWTIDDGDF